MGVAILGVLIGHWFSLSKYPTDNLILKILNFTPQLVFTQGFLLLSGFGLLYSFSKNSDVAAFYRRRFVRILIPFAFMSTPFFLYFLLVGDINVWQFMGRLTTISYWLEGNYCGMWYVALSVVLYLLYPIIHKVMMCKDGYWWVTGICLLLVALFVAITRIVQSLTPEYYQVHVHAFNGAFMFIVGMFLAYLSKQIRVKQLWGAGVLVLLFVISFLLRRYDMSYDFFYGGLKKTVIFIPAICVLFDVADRCLPIHPVRKILEWLGTYTLELYVLHLLFYCLLIDVHWGLNLLPITCISIAEAATLLLCVPVNKGINWITNKIITR